MKWKILLTIILILGLSLAEHIHTEVQKDLGLGDSINFTDVTKIEDGSGSGLDSDLLDGKDSTEFEGSLTTGNLTATSPIALDQTRQVIGGAAVISVASGYTIPTTTEKGNYDTVVINDPSDYDSYSDLPIAAVTNGDDTHVASCDGVYDFVIGLGYITATLTQEEVGAYVDALINDTDSVHTLITITYDDTDNAMDFVVNNDLHAYSWTNVVDGDIPDTITVGASGSVNDSAIPAGITRDSEWNTLSEIETVTSKNIIDSTEMAAAGYLTSETDPNVDTEAEIEAITGAYFGTSKAVTTGYIWVADGVDFESVAMSGDIAIIADGTTAIQANAVDSDDYTDDSIDDAHINWGTSANQVSLEDILAHVATGDMIYWNGSTWGILPIGTDNHVLTVATNIPNWEAASGGASEWTDQGTYLEPADAGESVRTKDNFQVVDDTNKIDMVGTALAVIAANQFYLSIGAAERFYIDENGNVGIATHTFGTSATNVFGVKAGTAPTSSPADIIQLYAEDVISTTELDYMECADDATAQATYVTSDGANSAWTVEDQTGDNTATGSSTSSDVNYRNVIQAAHLNYSGTKIRVKFSNTAGVANMYIDGASVMERSGTTDDAVAGTIKRLLFSSANTVTIAAGATLWSDWLTMDIDSSKDYLVHIFIDGATHASKYDIWTASENDRYYKATVTDNTLTESVDYTNDAYVLGISEIEIAPALQCYSEDTIKEQGSYALKGIARITGSLNETLTRTVSPVINLTGYNSIKVDARGSRTGSQFKIGIHDSGGTTSEHTINIATADTWQTETWDISGVSDANKDAVDSIIFTIVNADATNTFYIDNMYGQSAALAELKVRDEAGNVTTLSPHAFELFEPDDSQTFPFSYYSENKYIGKRINVDMYGLAREIEKLTGKKFIYEEDIKKQKLEKGKKLPDWLEKRRKEKEK